MGFYLVALKDGETKENVCGTSRQWLMYDIKTVRGAVSRARNWHNWTAKGIKKIEVYKFFDVFKDSTYSLVATLEK